MTRHSVPTSRTRRSTAVYRRLETVSFHVNVFPFMLENRLFPRKRPRVEGDARYIQPIAEYLRSPLQGASMRLGIFRCPTVFQGKKWFHCWCAVICKRGPRDRTVSIFDPAAFIRSEEYNPQVYRDDWIASQKRLLPALAGREFHVVDVGWGGTDPLEGGSYLVRLSSRSRNCTSIGFGELIVVCYSTALLGKRLEVCRGILRERNGGEVSIPEAVLESWGFQKQEWLSR